MAAKKKTTKKAAAKRAPAKKAAAKKAPAKKAVAKKAPAKKAAAKKAPAKKAPAKKAPAKKAPAKKAAAKKAPAKKAAAKKAPAKKAVAKKAPAKKAAPKKAAAKKNAPSVSEAPAAGGVRDFVAKKVAAIEPQKAAAPDYSRVVRPDQGGPSQQKCKSCGHAFKVETCQAFQCESKFVSNPLRKICAGCWFDRGMVPMDQFLKVEEPKDIECPKCSTAWREI